MSLTEYLRASMRRLHILLDETVMDLSEDQLHWRPDDTVNHIGFTIWHYTRTEDNMIRFVFNRQPTVWIEGDWDEKFGLDRKAQGTGMPTEDAHALRISSIQDFIKYMRAVWESTDSYLASITDSDLERTTLFRPQGEIPLRQIFDQSVLGHGYAHLGEIWILRSLQGLVGVPSEAT